MLTRVRFVFFSLAGFLFPLFAVAQGGSVNVQIANLRSDLDRLDQQVRSLLIDVEALSRENRQLRQQLQNEASSRSSDYVTLSRLNGVLDQFESKIQSANRASREALVNEVSKEIEALAEKTQKAINALAKAIDSQPQMEQVVTFSDDYPKSGTTYTVKRGDSLTKIARELGSQIDWIRNANRLSSDIIFPGQELFIPLKD